VGEHGQGDVPVPAVVAADPVLVEADFVLGGLEAFLDGPAGAGDADELVDRGSSGAAAQVVGQRGTPRRAPALNLDETLMKPHCAMTVRGSGLPKATQKRGRGEAGIWRSRFGRSSRSSRPMASRAAEFA
jgi:hypothetical protein